MRECDPDNRYDYAFLGIYAESQEELLEKVLEHVKKKYPEGVPERLEESLKPERNYTFEKQGYYDYIQSSKLASKIMICPVQIGSRPSSSSGIISSIRFVATSSGLLCVFIVLILRSQPTGSLKSCVLE